MGIIREEKQHETLPILLEVVETRKGETVEPWRFVQITMDDYDRMTPKELRELGWWLINDGKRIGREYKSNGALKVSA